MPLEEKQKVVPTAATVQPPACSQGVKGVAADREQRYITKVAARVGKKIRFIRVAEVHFFGGSGNYVEVHDGQGSVLIRESLNEIEAKLSPRKFIRVSRTAIVNVDFVDEMLSKGKRDIKLCLKSGQTIKLTRNLEQFRAMIQYS